MALSHYFKTNYQFFIVKDASVYLKMHVRLDHTNATDRYFAIATTQTVRCQGLLVLRDSDDDGGGTGFCFSSIYGCNIHLFYEL